jgi:hypothetical protein
MRYDKGREHAGRADENDFWLREFHAPAGVSRPKTTPAENNYAENN